MQALRSLLLAATFAACSLAPAAAQDTPKPQAPWVPDNGDGTYTNPVLHADYSDPDVVAVDGDYWLTSSSFNCVPGLPILHSKDLVNWKLVGHALPKLYAPAFDRPQHGGGVWAPSIRYHDGWYYIYWGDPDRGIYMVRTTDPRGEWSEPVLVKKAYGNIDPCPLWDDDGRVYMVHAFAHSRAGVKSLLQVVELNSEGTKIEDKGWIVFDGHAEHPTIEGPKFHKRNGYYYIFAPAGGVPTGWQTVLRSKNVRGPYEARIVMDQGNTEINGPHQGAWIDTPDGESWFMHFQDTGAYGRITHLQPMKWVDDWPVIGEDPDGDGNGQPVMVHAKPARAELANPATSDDFSSSQLGLQWQWHANPRPEWYSLAAREGHLRLAAVPQPDDYRNLWDTPNLLLQKFPARSFEASCALDIEHLEPGSRAGLLVMGNHYAYVGVERTTDGVQVVQRTCKGAERGTAESTSDARTIEADQIELRVAVDAEAKCRFSYRTGAAKWTPIGAEFTAKEGKWIGAKVGLFCTTSTPTDSASYVDVERFVVDRLAE
ncbi:glycoside hydrolase family 43 protein [Aeoliella sp.]|uniref:glycoside hydrolase family 43 protein n=1 Tax=Aeoliella sp. TaxID=2795800 RepID=UPI003CCBFC89